MSLKKLPGFSIVITLFCHSLLILGETFLDPEANKDVGLKVQEKRTTNFRVPLEQPYDPNFWPARGRRSRKEPEKPAQNDNCIAEENFETEKNFRCQEGNPSERKVEFELIPPVDLGVEPLAGTDCYARGRSKIPQISDGGLLTLKRLDEIRHKKQKFSGGPQLILYGNGVYWEPENLFGEKKKKQDVFWVARGKKNYLGYPLK